MSYNEHILQKIREYRRQQVVLHEIVLKHHESYNEILNLGEDELHALIQVFSSGSFQDIDIDGESFELSISWFPGKIDAWAVDGSDHRYIIVAKCNTNVDVNRQGHICLRSGTYIDTKWHTKLLNELRMGKPVEDESIENALNKNAIRIINAQGENAINQTKEITSGLS